ncbi:MAG: phosphotransferase, partial [Myxococcota bacterium]
QDSSRHDHHTQQHLDNLENTIAQASSQHPLHQTLQQEIQTVFEQLPPLLLPRNLPQHVVHGDPKFSNLLFNTQQQAVALIDLDTCNRHSLLVDLGDAIRSWCRESGGEDEIKTFSIERYQALLQGYLSAAPQLTTEERAQLHQAGPLITLELTARFITDAFQDQYFGWDDSRYPSRPAHNTARAQAMSHLAKQMLQQQEAMADVAQEAYSTHQKQIQV